MFNKHKKTDQVQEYIDAQKKQHVRKKTEEKEEKEEKTYWNERPKYAQIHHVECLCGTKFKSQARDIEFVKIQWVELPGEDKEEEQLVRYPGFLSFHACPKCHSNKIRSIGSVVEDD